MKKLIQVPSKILKAVLLSCMLLLPFFVTAQSIVNVRIPDVDKVICLIDHDDLHIEFDLEGDFPEDVEFTVELFPVQMQSVTLGESQGTENLSIPLTFPEDIVYNNARIRVSTQIDGSLVASDFIHHDIIPEINTNTGLNPDAKTIAPGETLTGTIPTYRDNMNPSQRFMQYKIVHIETETSVSDWMTIDNVRLPFEIPDAQEGTYQLFARARASDGTLCQDSMQVDGQFVLDHADIDPRLKIINVNIEGAEDNVLCLSDHPDPVMTFDIEGDFPDSTIFVAYIGTLSMPYEIGRVEGTDNLTTPVSFLDNYVFRNEAIYIEAHVGNERIQSFPKRMHIFPEINTSTGLSGPSEILPGERLTALIPEYTASQNPSQIFMEYLVVHLETETSATEWLRMHDTPRFIYIDDPEEGTYQLFARARTYDGTTTCQDSVKLDGSFTVSYSEPANIYNLNLSGLDDGVLCYTPGEELELSFDYQGVLDDETILTIEFLGQTFGGHEVLATIPVEEAGMGTVVPVTLPENLPTAASYSIVITYPDPESAGLVTGASLPLDVVTPVAADKEIFPDGEINIEPGETIEFMIPQNYSYGTFYKIVHIENEESVTDWMFMSDTPMQFTLSDLDEGTYRLYARGSNRDMDVICEDSVQTNGLFIIKHTIEEEPQIVNVNIPGVEDILCRDDAPDYIEFETLGDFPEGTTFRAFMVTEERTIPLGHPAELNDNRINVPFWPTRPNEDVEIFISATNGDLEVESERLMITYFSATEETVDYQVRNREGDMIEPVNGQYFLCEGERFTLYLHSIKGATYRWYRNGEHLRDIGERVHAISAAQTGVYTLEIILEHCPDIVKVRDLVFVAPLDNVEITAVGNVLKAPEALDYQWFRDGELLEGETNRKLTVEVEGEYTVQLISQGNCEATSNPYQYTITNVANALTNGEVKAFPNPVVDRLSIEADVTGEALVTITGIEGRVVYTETIYSGKSDLHVSQLPPGVYIVNIANEEKSYTTKIIKK
ncbi:T9SS type A sorting domain-containing protein [Cytophagaceae bacterium ABcell3]|nr:T9SS type A sorting domain-containing protein [Cytophagaceae bacterium ABcell3]